MKFEGWFADIILLEIFEPSPLLVIISIILSVLFFYLIDYITSSFYKKGKEDLSILIFSAVGIFTSIWLFLTKSRSGPWPSPLSSFSERMLFLFSYYISGLAIYALLNIPYLIYQYIKKKDNKRRTIYKIILLLILFFFLLVLAHYIKS